MRALRLERVLLASLIATALCLPSTRAGSLANFEAGALSSGSSFGGSSHGGDDCAGPFLELAARIWLEGMVYGGVGSWVRMDPMTVDMPDLPALEPREWGEGLIPVVRADTAYQWVEGDVRAVDAAVEAGFGPLAAQFTRRRFEERRPGRKTFRNTSWASWRAGSSSRSAPATAGCTIPAKRSTAPTPASPFIFRKPISRFPLFRRAA